MNDDEKTAKNPLGPTGERVMENVRHLREDVRRLSYRELSDRLTKIGRPIATLGLSRIEKGARRVDADDLVALAIALRVSPNRLLLSSSSDRRSETALTPTVDVDEGSAWDWADGKSIAVALLASTEPDGRGLMAAFQDFKQNARPAHEQGGESHSAAKSAADLLDRIQTLAGWMAEYERDRRRGRAEAPAYDYLGEFVERIELAMGRLQADVTELLSDARRLKSETTPAGTPRPEWFDLFVSDEKAAED